MRTFIILVTAIVTSLSCTRDDGQENGQPATLQLNSISVGNEELSLTETNTGLPLDRFIVIRFSQILDTSTVSGNISLKTTGDEEIGLSFGFLDGNRTISARPAEQLSEKTDYVLNIEDGIKGSKGETFPGIQVMFTTLAPPLEIVKLEMNGTEIKTGERISDVDFMPEISVYFSDEIGENDLVLNTSFLRGSINYVFTIQSISDSAYSFKLSEKLPYYRKIRFQISSQLSTDIEKEFEGLNLEFYTKLDTTPKFPLITDEELLTKVQEQTFKYFWDFAHPVSGLNRERNTSVENVTSGGSGFGVMAIPVGIERGFITRQEGIDRLEKIVHFLGNDADRFHGAWSHWLNGTTGKVNPFSSNDDGGDLVETSYMAMGLVTARQYLNPSDETEKEIIDSINSILESIEWDWYTQGENSLTWHWSPNYGWEKNMKIRGWNEALITYIMAASSTTHGISKEVYEQGWGGGSNMVNGKTFYDITLPLGRDYGGPLFFEHYTYLGVDPRNLTDQYADYWEQAVNHTLINRQHCIINPYNYIGYSEDCWGLTASDGNNGYSAHHPNNDRGVITPSAALSSIPFTPEQSMDAVRHFYYMLGDRLWGPYGFYDAFNVTAGWYATSNIAIDQGPILIMIENYRTGLLWDLFMSAPEIQDGLTKLGFEYQ